MQIQALILALAASVTAQQFDADFTVFPGQNCPDSTGTHIFASGKGQFFPNQRSIRVNQIRNGKHLVLYKGGSQTGASRRFYDPEGCINGDWLSYGTYNGGP